MPRSRRLPPYAGELTPLPPRPRGARAYLVLCAIVVPLGLGFLGGGLLLPSVLHERLGLAERVEVTVVDREWRARTPSAGRNAPGTCERYRYTVEWDDRTSTFSACLGSRLADLDVGDRTTVVTVPWSSQIDADQHPFWPVALLVSGLVVTG